MKLQWRPPNAAKLWKLLDQYKYVLIVIAVGIVLLLWPSGEKKKSPKAELDAQSAQEEPFDLAALEEKLSQTLSKVEGAGKVSVTLTVKSGM